MRHRVPWIAAVISILGLTPVCAVAGEPPPIIPRAVLFGNPDRAMPQISPDGTRLAYLAAVDGVMNVWVAPLDDLASAKAITKDKKRGIRQYFWAYTGQTILYVQDEGGDENWRVLATDIKSGITKDLTPFDSIKTADGGDALGPDGKKLRPTARVQEVSHKHPTEILIALNNRDPRLHDIHRVDLQTGEMTLVEKNEQGAVGYVTDDDYRVRLAVTMLPDGGSRIDRRTEEGKWEPFATIPQVDSLTTNPAGFAGDVLYMIDSRDRDTAALFALDLKSGGKKLLAEDPRADVGGILAHPKSGEAQAVAFEYDRERWVVLDKSIEADFAKLRSVADGDFSVVSRTLDDKTWVVAYEMDNGPVRYYRYDRAAKAAKFLFSNRSQLDGLRLARMQAPIITSRDGLSLVSYLTLPTTVELDAAGKPKEPVPMVLLVHGGPWARDSWGYNGMHQWLANRGYAVLSVNFRGSTGFGKKFVNAADGQWAGAMHDDLMDAVEWATRQGIADPRRVAIMGGSYGGYATLVGLTFTPTAFACGIDIVGPSNLITLMESIPPYWAPMIDMFATRVGDSRTEAGRQFLAARSPLTHVDRIQRPLLIGQGANDPRVKQAESDQIVAAMTQRKIPVTYVLYPDEGHGFQRPENRMSFNAVAEAFLAKHLGGRCEPFGGDLKPSTITVPSGADQIEGLADALPH